MPAKTDGAEYSFPPSTVLEDCDGDRWEVSGDGRLFEVLAPAHRVDYAVVERLYGPLTVVKTTNASGPKKPHGHDVALMGRAGSGKDTVAALLTEKYGHVRVAFADPLKEMALAVDPVIPELIGFDGSPIRLSFVVEIDGWEQSKRDYPEVRRFLQKLGAEGVRDVIGPDTWINLAHKKINEAHAYCRPVVLTDVRFPNEVAMARDLGFKLLWVDRPGVGAIDHASESSVGPDDADAIIYNGGSIEDLAARVTAEMGA